MYISIYHTPFVYIVYKSISDFYFFVQYVEKSFYDLTNPLIYDIIVVSKGNTPNKKGLDYMKKMKWYRFTWSDGYITECRGYSAQERRVMERDHGKLISKVFVGWI